MQTETLVVGGGLAGLRLAHQLTVAKRSFILVEARNRFGGRILTEELDGGYYDLGPSWYWPGQPKFAGLVSELGLSSFDQYSIGDLIFEDEQGRVQRGPGHAAMQGSFRLECGIGAIVKELCKRLPEKSLNVGTTIKTIKNRDDSVMAITESGQEISAKQIVLALPPRIAAHVTFDPVLPEVVKQALNSVPTWMAGQAKAIALYEHDFWREAGLSGDAMSRAGPLVEIHDASPADGGPFALFGFIGLVPQAREDEQVLRQKLRAQLVRLFGPDAAEPMALYVKDWAFDRCTSTTLDLQPLYTHPEYGMPRALHNVWEGRILFGGSEVAKQFGGYLEGALEAAECVFERLA
ncbi:MAG: flavin monoamine oxidase family protein [Hyphomicrobiales bacterium]